MGKSDMVHIYNGILLSNKNNAIMPFAATWLSPEIIILSEKKTDREMQMSYDIIYMWHL